jgi:hypothetical protein
VFIFQPADPIRDGTYLILGRALMTKDHTVLESPPVTIIINSTLNVPTPSPTKLADQPVTSDVILKDLRIEVHDQKPVLVGKSDLGDKVVANWSSIVLTSALIADTTTGDFYIEAPGQLPYGDHAVYVQAVRQSDGAMSKTVRLAFTISPALPSAAATEQLNPSAPEQKGAAAAAAAVVASVVVFAQHQSFLFWLILIFVILLAAGGTVYWYGGKKDKRGKKKKEE